MTAHRSPGRKPGSGLPRVGTGIARAVARAAVPAQLNTRPQWGGTNWTALRSEELRRLADAMAGVGGAPGAEHLYAVDHGASRS